MCFRKDCTCYEPGLGEETPPVSPSISSGWLVAASDKLNAISSLVNEFLIGLDREGKLMNINGTEYVPSYTARSLATGINRILSN